MGRKNKVDATGRDRHAVGSSGRFMAVRHSVLWSPYVSALSPLARVLMFELGSMFDGKNNGRIFLSQRDAAKRCGVADVKATAKAFAELQSLGLLTITLRSHRDMRSSAAKAQAFRLNWINGDGCWSLSRLPDFDPLAVDKRRRKRLAERQGVLKAYTKGRANLPVEDSSTLSVREGITVENFSTLPLSRPLYEMRPGEVADSSTYISNQGGRGRCGSCRSPFKMGRRHQLYCSPKCRKAAERKRAADRSRPGWWASLSSIIDKVAANDDLVLELSGRPICASAGDVRDARGSGQAK